MITSTENRNIPQGILLLARTYNTPFLVIEKKGIIEKFQQFKESLPESRIFYALKTNTHKAIVATLEALDSGFEIASESELNLLLRHEVSPQKIVTSNPIKSTSFIEKAYAAGVRLFAFDSYDEVNKLARFARGSRVYIRLTVSNEGSQWPLANKFGVEIEQAAELLSAAAAASLVPYGITFHVGSQCIDETSWIRAIKKSRLVWEIARERGMELKMLNIGGGFPIEYTEPVSHIEQIAVVIQKTLAKHYPEDIEVFVEPGRSLVGESGMLVARVIAKARRGDLNWLYLDVGVFNGLMESMGGIKYPMAVGKDGPVQPWVVAGPSCDSFDVISNEIYLPEPEIGDYVFISSAGAYTTSYASRFNGFPIPRTYFI